jgi:hypothetical protein
MEHRTCHRQVTQSKCPYPHFLLDLHIENRHLLAKLHEARRRQVGDRHRLRVPL